MKELTYDDCDVLIEALDEWIKKGETGMLLGGIVSTMLKDKTERPDEIENLEKRKQMEHEEKKRARKKIAAKLKAKLYEIQDNCEVVNNGS